MDRIRRAVQEFRRTHVIPDPLNGPLPMGRPKLVTADLLTHIKSQVEEHPEWSLQRLKIYLENAGFKLSMKSIRVAKHSLRFCYGPPKQRQVLTVLHMQRRLEFAFAMLVGG
jgi:transposase